MLDSITKKRIDDLRDILVGKIPSPQSQVEQITTALIYKFMYDMDREAVNMGGVPSFFTGEYEKYSWEKLFESKLSGADKVQLYSDAIEHMYTNPSAPEFFRELFKNSYLPFRDPSTLNMFLKLINEFEYSHSEILGDAFEYLLSFMGSQGDAGQFRTPRHIIDFIVTIVNPQKNESILDPSCGTAGFLISSYRHILKQNTNKKTGDKLTAGDKKIIGNNLVGYDISPDMKRISSVNMYLHGFANPNIYEYDTLSNADRWQEYRDVILANPPFMTPKGGIIPHNLFSIDSKKSEVLFLDFIISHLKPSGRCAVIVPEGINFVSNAAYKSIRKKCLDNGLICDISLPHGVFKPYASVKTHILILDKLQAESLGKVLFVEIENDGFSQSDTRTPVDGEELSSCINLFKEFVKNKTIPRSKNPLAYAIDTATIKKEDDLHLIGRWYDLPERIKHSPESIIVSLGELCLLKKGLSPNMNTPPGDFQMVVPAPSFKSADNYDYEGKAICIPLVSSAGHGKADIKRLHFVEGKFALANTMCAIFVKDEKKVLPEYLYVYLTSKMNDLLVPLMKGATNVTMDMEHLIDLKIPVPTMDIQQKIATNYMGERFARQIFDQINLLKKYNLESHLQTVISDLSKNVNLMLEITSDSSELNNIL